MLRLSPAKHMSSCAWQAAAEAALPRLVGTGNILEEKAMQIEPQEHGQIRPDESRTAGNVLLHWTVAIVFMTALIGGAALFF